MFLAAHEFHKATLGHVYQVFVVTALDIQIVPVLQCLIPDNVQTIDLPQRRYRPDFTVVEELSQAVFADQLKVPVHGLVEPRDTQTMIRGDDTEQVVLTVVG